MPRYSRRSATRFLSRACRYVAALRQPVGLVLVVSATACGGLEPVSRFEPITDPTQLYIGLVLNHRAITLSTVAPYDKFQLTATPLDATGAPITVLPAPTFTSLDTAKVWVTPEGELQARAAAEGVQVIASLTAPGNIRHADTAIVNVNLTSDPPPVLTAVVFDPQDSTVHSMHIEFNFAVLAPFRPTDWYLTTATAHDAQGTELPGIAIAYRSLDSSVAKLDSVIPQFVRIHDPGRVRMVAEAVAYGVTKADTVVYTVTWPVLQTIFASADGRGSFSPATVRLAPSGIVVWQRQGYDATVDTIDVTFDDTAHVGLAPANICARFDPLLRPDLVGTFGPGPHCGTGNLSIPPIPPIGSTDQLEAFWTVQVRQFPVPGVYRYHSARTGASGQIIVTNDPDPTAIP